MPRVRKYGCALEYLSSTILVKWRLSLHWLHYHLAVSTTVRCTEPHWGEAPLLCIFPASTIVTCPIVSVLLQHTHTDEYEYTTNATIETMLTITCKTNLSELWLLWLALVKRRWGNIHLQQSLLSPKWGKQCTGMSRLGPSLSSAFSQIPTTSTFRASKYPERYGFDALLVRRILYAYWTRKVY